MSQASKDDWHLWWTRSFTRVDWPYPSPPNLKSSTQPFSKPPFYRLSLSEPSSSPSNVIAQFPSSSGLGDHVDEGQDQAGDLNPELEGVKCAEEVLTVYEFNVGFYPAGATVPTVRRRKLRTEVPQVESRFVQHKWNQLMADLYDSHDRKQDFLVERSPQSTVFGDSCSESGLSTLGSFDLSSSFTSASSISMPSTPMPKNPHEAVTGTAVTLPLPPSSTYLSPSKRLNATASTFIPSPSKPDKPSKPRNYPPNLANFTFPSLSVPPVPSVKIQKDEQGFYSGIDEASSSTPTRDQLALLPPFLHEGVAQRKPHSRTRVMVDRLRSTSQEPGTKSSLSMHSISLSPSPSLEDSRLRHQPRLSVSEGGGDQEPFSANEDGWIDVNGHKPPSSSPKDIRTKELFKALRRHRSDSKASESTTPSSSDERTDGRSSPSLSTPALSSSSTISSPSSSIQSSNDGWIEGATVPPAPKVKHKRRQSANSRSQHQTRKKSSQASLSSMPFLAKPMVPPHGYPYVNHFIQPPPTAAHPHLQYTPAGIAQATPYFYGYPAIGAFPGYVQVPMQYPFNAGGRPPIPQVPLQPPQVQAQLRHQQQQQLPPQYPQYASTTPSRPYAI